MHEDLRLQQQVAGVARSSVEISMVFLSLPDDGFSNSSEHGCISGGGRQSFVSVFGEEVKFWALEKGGRL